MDFYDDNERQVSPDVGHLSLFYDFLIAFRPRKKMAGRQFRHVTPATENWLIEPTFHGVQRAKRNGRRSSGYLFCYFPDKESTKNEENAQRRRPTGHTKMRKASKIQ